MNSITGACPSLRAAGVVEDHPVVPLAVRASERGHLAGMAIEVLAFGVRERLA